MQMARHRGKGCRFPWRDLPHIYRSHCSGSSLWQVKKTFDVLWKVCYSSKYKVFKRDHTFSTPHPVVRSAHLFEDFIFSSITPLTAHRSLLHSSDGQMWQVSSRKATSFFHDGEPFFIRCHFGLSSVFPIMSVQYESYWTLHDYAIHGMENPFDPPTQVRINFNSIILFSHWWLV